MVTRKAKAAIFTAEERAAMKARARESKAQAGREAGEKAVLAALAKMPEPDRSLGRTLHALVRTHAPMLAPRTWYGMPAYARDDKVVCFFQNAGKFKTRYATLGFSDKARLDDGSFWPVAFALKDMSAAEEKKIAALIRKAIG
jgi:uncharacterized protein YdhG (YjbR/CyaY superfamily)